MSDPTIVAPTSTPSGASATTASMTDYSKLTVPQLKARCKELKLTGYSKLGKVALQEKLAPYGGSVPNPSVDQNLVQISIPTASSGTMVSNAPANETPTHPKENIATSPILVEHSPLTLNMKEGSLAIGKPIDAHAPSALRPQESLVPIITPFSTSSVPIATHSSSSSATPSQNASESAKGKKVASIKRPLTDSSASASQKKAKLPGSSSIKENLASDSVPLPSKILASKPSFTSLAPSLITTKSTAIIPDPKFHPAKQTIVGRKVPASVSSSTNTPATNKIVSSSRFRPLMPLRPVTTKSQSNLKPHSLTTPSTEQLAYLDFSLTPSPNLPVTFQPISLPPSLSQRKSITAWSVILSGLSDTDRRQCILVSRAIRYAVYLSAVPIITRTFGARRFDQLSRKYNMAMTNFWPYLNPLRSELEDRKRAYNASFLPRFFRGRLPVDNALWGCPKNDKQLLMALRFVMTRVWFAISINSRDRERAKDLLVIDACEIVPNEIWSITQKSKTGLETFYVLEQTCEVIGTAPPSKNAGSPATTPSDPAKAAIRVDWSNYVQHRLSNTAEAISQPPLLSQLRWTNGEEYNKGISRLWLKRIENEGEVGEYKKKVAKRYVLACVVGNSVSGQWMSSSHMAQVFSGTASESDTAPASLLRKEVQRVNLFLPAHHLVESVHFKLSGIKPGPLHPAIASIQTPVREYFILRDNGMEVGCEEDGIWPAWMELLNCDARGVAYF